MKDPKLELFDLIVNNREEQHFERPDVYMKNTSFLNDAEFLTYIQRAIFKKSPLKREKLLGLLHNYGKSVVDLNALSFLGPASIVMDDIIIKGEIKQKGNGIRGISGTGPITYYFSPLDTTEFLKAKKLGFTVSYSLASLGTE